MIVCQWSRLIHAFRRALITAEVQGIMAPSPETIGNEWRQEPPVLDDFVDSSERIGAERYYWVRGWNFNRPVLCRVTMGARTRDGELQPELNYELLRSHYEGRSELWWEREFVPHLNYQRAEHPSGASLRGRNWRPLEWFGPLATPPGSPRS